MPFIVRILAEDLPLWEEYEHTIHIGEEYLREKLESGRFSYRLKQTIYKPELEQIKVSAPARLDTLVGKDLHCFIRVEKGYLSRSTGSQRRIHFRLTYLDRPMKVPRPVRLRIASIDTGKSPPRVMLEELK